MYHPLPPRLTIKPSLISGLGLFATAGIAQGTNLGTTHIKVDGTIFRTPLGVLLIVMKTQIALK